MFLFIHDCFWHRRENCIETSRPKTNSEYRKTKIQKTIESDKKHQAEIQAALVGGGWDREREISMGV
jgi:G:T-mismatch repair DNA endonuclease (very short patch repair protein)